PAVLAREADQREVRAVQHDLEREQHDQRAAAQEDAERARREQERRDREVPGDVRAGHQSGGASVLAGSPVRRREWLPRRPPPTAATSRTIDVISKASRWSVRKRRPTSRGLPNELVIFASCESRPPALRPITTITSTRIAAAAPTAPIACQLGPPAHGASA